MKHLDAAKCSISLLWMLVTGISRICENSVNCDYDLFAFLYHCYYTPVKSSLDNKKGGKKELVETKFA